MSIAVRCPRCRALSQVGAAAVGRTVVCPSCRATFRAAPLPPPPVVAPVPEPEPLAPDDGLTSALLGLALLPLGVPLLWLVARLTLRAEPVFTFAAPLAVGLGATGLAVGVGLVRMWSHAARVRAVLALAAGGYLIGGGLFVVPKDWPAAARKLFGPKQIQWKPFSPKDRAYTAELPNGAASEVDGGPVDGWKLTTFTTAAGQPDDKRGVWAVRYTLAHGVPPGDERAADDAWFAAVRDAVVEASGGELTAERPLTVSDKPARELQLTLPNKVTHRVVRLVRARNTLVYAAAEGLFLTPDGDEVAKFLGGLVVK